jgi:hypothetical protein
VPGANFVPSNFKTWLVVAPEGSICMPLTDRDVAIATEEGRERVYTPVVALAATAISLAVPTTLDIKLTPYYSICCFVLIEQLTVNNVNRQFALSK